MGPAFAVLFGMMCSVGRRRADQSALESDGHSHIDIADGHLCLKRLMWPSRRRLYSQEPHCRSCLFGNPAKEGPQTPDATTSRDARSEAMDRAYTQQSQDHGVDGPETFNTGYSALACRLKAPTRSCGGQDTGRRTLSTSPTTFGKDRIPPGLRVPCLHAATCLSCSRRNHHLVPRQVSSPSGWPARASRPRGTNPHNRSARWCSP